MIPCHSAEFSYIVSCRHANVANMLKFMESNLQGVLWITARRDKDPISRDQTEFCVLWTTQSLQPSSSFKGQLPIQPRTQAKRLKRNSLRSEFQSPTNAETDDGRTCVVCLQRASEIRLLPCNHDSFCRPCLVEMICTWTRWDAPNCPLCRSSFATMIFLDW